MKNTIILFSLCCWAVNSYGQSIAPAGWISSANYYDTSSGISLHGSFGELSTEHFSAGDYSLSQGFLQTYLQITSAESAWPDDLVLTVGPNPFTQQFTVEQSVILHSVQLQVLDLQGRPIYEQPITDLRTRIDLSTLPAGTYLLRFWLSDTAYSITSKIIKL